MLPIRCLLPESTHSHEHSEAVSDGHLLGLLENANVDTLKSSFCSCDSAKGVSNVVDQWGFPFALHPRKWIQEGHSLYQLLIILTAWNVELTLPGAENSAARVIPLMLVENCFKQDCVKHMEKAMVPHSSTLAWKIPWMEGPGGLRSMGSLRVRHDWATSLPLFTFMQWRRKWQPTPVFLPGESQGWGSLVGCCVWGHTESDTTEVT